MFISLRLRCLFGRRHELQSTLAEAARVKTDAALGGAEGKVGARQGSVASFRDSLVFKCVGCCVCVWVQTVSHSHNIVFGLPAEQSAQHSILAFLPYRATAFDQSSD